VSVVALHRRPEDFYRVTDAGPARCSGSLRRTTGYIAGHRAPVPPRRTRQVGASAVRALPEHLRFAAAARADLIAESWLCDWHATDGSLHAVMAAIATSSAR